MTDTASKPEPRVVICDTCIAYNKKWSTHYTTEWAGPGGHLAALDHHAKTGHQIREHVDKAPRIVAECWTCKDIRDAGPRLIVIGYDRRSTDRSCRAAGHDVREVKP